MSAVPAQELTLPQLPHMDESGLACFKARIGASRTYLEYGCGGSTVYAASVAQLPVIIAVDSDRHWVDALRKELASSSSKLFVEHCDIGEVREWGIPTDERGIKNYWRYSTKPWTIAKTHGFVPDLVLIDGSPIELSKILGRFFGRKPNVGLRFILGSSFGGEPQPSRQSYFPWDRHKSANETNALARPLNARNAKCATASLDHGEHIGNTIVR